MNLKAFVFLFFATILFSPNGKAVVSADIFSDSELSPKVLASLEDNSVKNVFITINSNKDSIYVFDDFDLEGPGIVGDSSGFGWAGSWGPSGNTDNTFNVNSTNSLSYPSGVRLSSTGGYVYNSLLKGIGHGRYLSNGIVLGSTEADFSTTFYVSFLAQKDNTGYFRIDGGDGANVRFSAGVNVDGTLKTNIAGTINESDEVFFQDDRTYLVVARWHYENNQSDMKMILFEDGESIPGSDDGLTWNMDHTGAETGIVMEYLRFAISRGTVMLDEFRIGSTWTSVIGNLDAPQNLRISPETGDAAAGDTTTTLTWDDVENESGYKIFVNDRVVGSVEADVTEYQITGLNKAPTYDLSVGAFNDLGTSARSNIETFTVNNPFAKDFYVQDYGAVGDGISNDFSAIVAAVNDFADFPSAANLHFEDAKIYRCEGRGVLFRLNEVQNKSIYGNNAIILGEAGITGLRINESENVLVKDLIFDYHSLSWTQGRIVTVDATNGSFTMDVEEGFPIPVNNFAASNPSHPQSWGMFWGPEGYEIKNELVYIDESEILEGNTVKFRVRDDIKSALDDIQEGDQFSVDILGLSGPFHLIEKSGNITCRNITMYAAKGQGFIPKQNHGELHFDNIQLRRKPGSSRLMSIYRGGIINRDNAIGPLIENCYFDGGGDDAIALSAFTYYVNASNSDTQFTFNDATTFEEGDTILFADMSTGIELGKTVIISKSGNAITTEDAISGVSPGEDRAPSTTNVWNISRSDNDFIIRNNTFAGQRRYAILCRAQYGLIEGNVGEKTGAGIVLSNEIGPAYSGPVPRDITIQNNSFTSIRRWPFIAQFKAHTSTPDQLLQNIKIIDNTFGPKTLFVSARHTEATGPAVVLENAGNVEFSGNSIVNDTQGGAIALENCRNIDIQCENTFNQAPIISLEDGISIDQNMNEDDVVFMDCETSVPSPENIHSKVRLYPVPAVEELKIECDELMHWSIINMLGKEILTGSEKNVNVSSLQSGTFLIKIWDRKNRVFVKLFTIK